MLLLRLDTMLSGCQRKMYMIKAQVRLAKTGHAFSLIFVRDSGVISDESGCILG